MIKILHGPIHTVAFKCALSSGIQMRLSGVEGYQLAQGFSCQTATPIDRQVTIPLVGWLLANQANRIT